MMKSHNGGLHARGWPVLIFLLSSIICGPIIFFASQNISISNPNEEFVAYGYFYSMRALYGFHEYPWFPQAHLTGLLYRAIHLFLDMAGYDRHDIVSRVDIFNDLAVLAPLLAASVAMPWALAPFRSLAAKLCVVAVFLAFWFQPDIGIRLLTTPQYYPWAIPNGVLAMGALLRAANGLDLEDRRGALLLGLGSGLAASVKFTFLIPWTPIYMLVAWQLFGVRRGVAVRYLGISLGTCVAVWAVVLTLYFGGRLKDLRGYWVQMALFMTSLTAQVPAASDHNYVRWMYRWGFVEEPRSLVRGIVALSPIILACGLFFRKTRQVSMFLLVALVAAIRMYHGRYYSWTFVELTASALALTVVGGSHILHNASSLRARFARFGRTGPWAAMVLLWVGVGALIFSVRDDFLGTRANFAVTQGVQLGLDQYLASRSGKLLMLVPDNRYRFATMHGAICKGGTDIYRPTWGVSPLMTKLFSDFECFVTVAPVDLSGVTKLTFVRDLDEPVAAAFKRIASTYHPTAGGGFDNFDCQFDQVQGGTAVVGCLRR